jgi:hypothetical protein
MEIDWYYENSYCSEHGKPPLQENEIEVQIPFIGTYGALSDMIDSEMECERDWREQEGMTADCTVTFRMYEFLTDYTERIAKIVGLASLKFRYMYSPQYYNFTTDKIFCSVDKNELWELYKQVRSDLMGDTYYRAEVGEATTSRDGYIPYYHAADCHYSNIEELAESPACLLGMILDAKCSMWLEYEEQIEHDLLLSSFELWWRFYDDIEMYQYMDFCEIEES